MVRLILLFSAFGLSACQMPGLGPSGASLYGAHCAKCHGAQLDGNGPHAAVLPVAPADLTGLSARNGGVFPMINVITQIHGYPGRFHGGLMPEFAPELSADQAIWTAPDGEPHSVPREILTLARYLEQQQQ